MKETEWNVREIAADMEEVHFSSTEVARGMREAGFSSIEVSQEVILAEALEAWEARPLPTPWKQFRRSQRNNGSRVQG